MSKHKRFVVGVEKSKMRLYNVSQAAQANIQDAGQVPDDEEKKNMKKPFELARKFKF
jgi:hypothetical protein